MRTLVCIVIALMMGERASAAKSVEPKVPRRIHYAFSRSDAFVMVTVQETADGAKGDVVLAKTSTSNTPPFRGAFHMSHAEFEQSWSTLNAPGVAKRRVEGSSLDLSADYAFRAADGTTYYVPMASPAPAVRALAVQLRALVDKAAVTMRQIPPTRVTGVEVIDYGIYQLKPTGELRKAPGTGSGKWSVTSEPRLLKKTDSIPARIGTTFGIKYKILGTPKDDPVEILFRVRHPKILNPETGKSVSVEQCKVTVLIGAVDYRGYTLGSGADLQPARWVLQILVNSKIVVEHEFQVGAAN